MPCQATYSGTAGVVPGCPLPGFGIHAHLDRGARPLVDEAFLRAEPPSAVCDADFDFEGCRVADVVAGRQRMGYDIDVEQKVVARPGFEPCAAAAGVAGGRLAQGRGAGGGRFEPTSATCASVDAKPVRLPAVSKQPHISATL